MKKIFFFLLISLTFLIADEVSDLEKLRIGIGKYFIAQQLTQKDIAQLKSIPTNVKGTLKFADGDLNLVVRKRDNRIIIIYQRFMDSTRDKLQKTISQLIIDFGEPTVISHEKIIYWAFNKKRIITQDEFQEFKDKLTKPGATGNKKVALKDFLKQQQKVQDKDVKLNAIATVKLNSDKNIYAKDSEKVNFYFILTAVNLIQKL